MSVRIEQLAQDIVSNGLAKPTDFVGCSPVEIESLQEALGLTLPETYRERLEIMGRSAGRYLAGSDAFYPDLLELRQQAEELLSENGHPFSLPEDAFVFLVHQGYQFLYFRAVPLDQDPPVIYYLEGSAPV